MLVLLVITCVDQTLTGPHLQARAALNLSALAPQGGAAPVPFDSIEITLARAQDQSIALDTLLGFRGDTSGDSAVVRLNVVLRQSPEAFLLSVRAFGGGITWYTASSSLQIAVGAQVAPATLLVQYIGPGANAARVTMGPVDTTAVGGITFPLRATVYDSGGKAITGVPVGYRVSDTTRASVAYPTAYAATLTGKATVRDSVWVVASTPTHLKDSTRVHIVPPATALIKKAGDVQTSILGAPLPVALAVQVLDALNGGFKGDTVHWSVTAGSGTLQAAVSVTDSTGLATMPVTPTALGALTVQAAVAGLAGSPVTFTETAIAGTIKTVTISPKIDTIANGTTVLYTAVAKDPLGNVVTTTFGWTSLGPTVATVSSAGLAAALGGDSTKIIAAAGGVADTARLYVRALRTITLSPADTVITAVGDSLLLKAAAIDNFGAPITTGLNIRYLSASTSIAVVNALTGRINITGPGNAVILAKDSVATSDSLVRGSATLRVNQVTAGIVNNPKDSVVVGVNGQTQVVATAVDSNGHPIAGKTFVWVTRPLLPTGGPIATVTSAGLVTGLVVGDSTYAVDTLVDGASVFKDSTKVLISAAPPQLIEWGFDSTSVGNGGNVSIALAVTTPPPSTPLTIAISSSDSTIAKASPNTVTIGVGSSATSAVIYGERAGRVVLTATDASGQGYSSKQMIVGVVSTITFREIANPSVQQPYFYLNQNQTHKAQVWLSDPAPASGLGITFVYKLGTAAVAPSPAFIPGGQLSADVTLQGLSPGPSGQPDSVVPTSGGYIGKFSSVYVASDSLRLTQAYPSTGLLGVGQSMQPYAQITYAMDHPLILSAALSAPIGTVQGVDTIATNGTTSYVTIAATATGADTLSVSASGWVSAKLPFVFTTPQLVASGQASIIAGAPTDGYWSVSTADSLRYGHPVTASDPVTITSRNTAAIVVDTPTTASVPVNQVSVSRYGLRALPGAGGTSAWIVATAPGYRPDSFLVSVALPALTLAAAYPSDAHIAIGTVFQNAGYVQIPYARTDTFWVVFSHTHKGAVAGPDSVSIPKGQTTGYFSLTADSLVTDAMTITRATGYQVSGSPLSWVVDSIHVRPNYYPTTLYSISNGQYVTAIALDPVDNQARPLVNPLPVTLTATNPNAFALDSTIVTIPAGQYLTGPDSLRVRSAASGKIQSSAPGSTADSSGLITVNLTPLSIALGYPYTGYVARGLELQGNYVYLPAAAPNSLTVAIQRFAPTKDSLSASSVIIPKGATTSSPFTIVGLDTVGTDTVKDTLAGFVTAKVTITLQHDSLEASRLGATHLTTEGAEYAYVYTLYTNGYLQSPVSPVTFTLQSTDSSVIQIDSAGTVSAGKGTGTSVVAANQTSGSYRVRYVGSGSARVRVTAPGFHGDSTELVSVTGPSLHFEYAPTISAGVSQAFVGDYVYVDNAVTGTPLTVYLARSDSLSAPASQVFQLCASGSTSCTTQTDSVVIPIGQSSSNAFELDGQSVGSADVIARATGYNSTTTAMAVGQPRLLASSHGSVLSLYVGLQSAPVYVYTEDQTNSQRIVTAPIVIKDSSSQPVIVLGDSLAKTVPVRGTGTVFSLSGLVKGSAAIIYTTPGYTSDTTQVTVDTATLVLSGGGVVSVNSTTQLLLSLPYVTASAVTVSLTSSNPNAVSVPTTVTIPAATSYVYFNATGVAAGTVAINATATGFHPAIPVSITAQ